MKKILFIGSFLSSQNGSLSISEKTSNKLSEIGVSVKLSSRFSNKVIRILDIIISICISRANILHIDVYSGQAFIITEIASWIGHVFKKRMIFTLHGGALPDFYSTNAQRIHRAFRRADIISTPSRMLLQFFEEKGFSIRYIPNSVDLRHFPYDRSSVHPCSLLWIRAFDPIYNPKIAVSALAKVRAQYPQAMLTMIGPDKGVLGEVRELISDLKIEPFVHITGPVSNTDLYKYYQTHEVFLNTTSYESFGVAVLEAAACGIPIISSKVGEIPLIWKAEDEILMVEDLDAAAYAKQIIRLLNQPQLNESLSQKARKKAEAYDWEHIKPLWLHILNMENEN